MNWRGKPVSTIYNNLRMIMTSQAVSIRLAISEPRKPSDCRLFEDNTREFWCVCFEVILGLIFNQGMNI